MYILPNRSVIRLGEKVFTTNRLLPSHLERVRIPPPWLPHKCNQTEILDWKFTPDLPQPGIRWHSSTTTTTTTNRNIHELRAELDLVCTNQNVNLSHGSKSREGRMTNWIKFYEDTNECQASKIDSGPESSLETKWHCWFAILVLFNKSLPLSMSLIMSPKWCFCGITWS